MRTVAEWTAHWNAKGQIENPGLVLREIEGRVEKALGADIVVYKD